MILVSAAAQTAAAINLFVKNNLISFSSFLINSSVLIRLCRRIKSFNYLLLFQSSYSYKRIEHSIELIIHLFHLILIQLHNLPVIGQHTIDLFLDITGLRVNCTAQAIL